MVGKIDGAGKPYLDGTYHLVCITYGFEELVAGVCCRESWENEYIHLLPLELVLRVLGIPLS